MSILGTDRLLRPRRRAGVVFERGGGIFLNELFFFGGGGNFLPCTKSEGGGKF